MHLDTQQRLTRLRGDAPAKRHNARTIAALTGNPGCGRRAVLDAAGIDKDALARNLGFPSRFGQSQFAITRGNTFERQVKANGFAELLALLRDTLELELTEVGIADLEEVGGNTSTELRFTRSRQALLAAADDRGRATFFDHPLLRIDVGGNDVYLEPDLVAFQHEGKFHVVEIKSFAVIDRQADGTKVAAAARQSAVYVLALRRLLGAERVSDEVVLVCPENFSNKPTAAKVDVRKQLIILDHQLTRLERIETLVAALPPDLSLDLTGNTVDELATTVSTMEPRYAPECLASCEMAFFCRHQGAGRTETLGISVREELGGVETVSRALSLADGTAVPSVEEEDAATLLRLTARAYDTAVAA
jgi:hypothetical protein